MTHRIRPKAKMTPQRGVSFVPHACGETITNITPTEAWPELLDPLHGCLDLRTLSLPPDYAISLFLGCEKGLFLIIRITRIEEEFYTVTGNISVHYGSSPQMGGHRCELLGSQEHANAPEVKYRGWLVPGQYLTLKVGFPTGGYDCSVGGVHRWDTIVLPQRLQTVYFETIHKSEFTPPIKESPEQQLAKARQLAAESEKAVRAALDAATKERKLIEKASQALAQNPQLDLRIDD